MCFIILLTLPPPPTSNPHRRAAKNERSRKKMSNETTLRNARIWKLKRNSRKEKTKIRNKTTSAIRRRNIKKKEKCERHERRNKKEIVLQLKETPTKRTHTDTEAHTRIRRACEISMYKFAATTTTMATTIQSNDSGYKRTANIYMFEYKINESQTKWSKWFFFHFTSNNSNRMFEKCIRCVCARICAGITAVYLFACSLSLSHSVSMVCTCTAHRHSDSRTSNRWKCWQSDYTPHTHTPAAAATKIPRSNKKCALAQPAREATPTTEYRRENQKREEKNQEKRRRKYTALPNGKQTHLSFGFGDAERLRYVETNRIKPPH